VEDKIVAIIAENLEVSAGSIGRDSDPSTIENWDSTNHMKMIIGLEMAFDIEFNEFEIVELLSVGQVIDAVNQKLA